ncbi:MAG: ABC transporter ATP-binding protein, partial [Bacilli bacterium]
LIPRPPGKIVSGKINFNGKDLVSISDKEMRKIRGNKIAMIFQEPMTSLNPVFTIGNQLTEVIQLHLGYNKAQSKVYAIEMLEKVGIARADKIVDEYPHQLSGGMRQRVMIAMAMACNPSLLIADEPTTALDVTIQAQMLELMRDLNHNFKTSILFITHDFGVVAEIAHRVVVMYAGKIVEEADVHTIFKNHKHPYTKGLIQSIPKMVGDRERLYAIPGNVPFPGKMNQGCAFAPRCSHAFDRCHEEMPALYSNSEGHKVRCWLHAE